MSGDDALSTTAIGPPTDTGVTSRSDDATADTTTTPVGTGSTGTGLGSGDDTAADDPVQAAIDRGIEGAQMLADADLVMLLLLDVIHRRFEVDAFATAATQYDDTLAGLPMVPIDAVAFRRVFDPGQTLTAQELAEVAPGVNEVTVPALLCDTLPLAADYGDRLVTDAALGGYELTHVTLALRWLDELGCTGVVDATFVAQVVDDTVALIDAGDGLDDLEVEAATFTAVLAGPEPLPPNLSETLVRSQLPDGTWPRAPGNLEGNGHTTALALMLLLQLHRTPADAFLATR